MLETAVTVVPVWTHIILHHTASSKTKTVEQLRREHLARGWRDIGYHYLVDYTGGVHAGRPPNEPGAHAQGWNSKAIGVATIGDISEYPMGEDQRGALVQLVRHLMDEHGIPAANVLYHRDVGATSCPGRFFPDIKAAVGAPFKDVPPDHWAAAAVESASEAGLLGGYPDGTFRGDEPVTRYELAAFAAKLWERVKG
ncbi:MAG: N-acetylmuramoyl-L-alanine amidase [Bacillota bacterium]